MIFWFLAIILVGVWFVFTIIPKDALRFDNLEIIATGQKHPDAEGNEVWVQALWYSSGETKDLKEFKLGPGWELRDGALVSYQNQPSTLRWSGRADQDMKLLFTSHPWSGIVEIIWNGEQQIIDLYNPEPTTREVTLNFSAKSNGMPQWKEVLLKIIIGACIGIILFMVSAWLISHNGLTESQLSRRYPQILISLCVLSLYFVIAFWLFPPGVNKDFLMKFALFIVPVTTFLSIAFIVTSIGKKEKLQFLISDKECLDPRDLLLLFLPLTPVFQYILNNTEILSYAEAILLFTLSAAIVSIPIIIIPLLLRQIVKMRPMMFLGLAFTFSITNMALLSKQFAWHETGETLVQLAIFCFIWAAFWLLYRIKMKEFAYIAVVLFFLSNSIFQLSGINDTLSTSEISTAENKLIQRIGDRKPAKTPNIYLLVYDAYVPNETMLAYGIDNSQQEKYLEENGFKLYPHTYTLAGTSIASMSRVLNASTSFYGDTRRATSGDGVVQNLLKKFGYQTYGVFPSGYYFLGNPSTYDYSYPGYANSIKYLIDGILIGEFKFDIGYEDVTLDKLNRVKYDVFSEDHNHPIFLYTHLHLPDHSQNSGECLPNETELYKERLDRANIMMRDDIELVIKNDPDSIIIVAGDHGPYLTKNCYSTGGKYSINEITRLDLQDRYGTFLAIRWPSSQFENYDDITVLQDVFPAVFAYLFEDQEILEAKVEPNTLDPLTTSGASVSDGIIIGGINDGEPLYIGQNE